MASGLESNVYTRVSPNWGSLERGLYGSYKDVWGLGFPKSKGTQQFSPYLPTMENQMETAQNKMKWGL